MCDEGRDILIGCETKVDALRLYKARADWSLKRNFPSLDFIRSEFAGMEDEGLYVDKTFHGELLNDRQSYFLHHCDGEISLNINREKRIIPMIYVANGCRLRLRRTGGFPSPLKLKIPIYVFGDTNQIDIVPDANTEFVLYEAEMVE